MFVVGDEHVSFQDWSQLAKLSEPSLTNKFNIRFYTVCLTKSKWGQAIQDILLDPVLLCSFLLIYVIIKCNYLLSLHSFLKCHLSVYLVCKQGRAWGGCGLIYSNLIIIHFSLLVYISKCVLHALEENMKPLFPVKLFQLSLDLKTEIICPVNPFVCNLLTTKGCNFLVLPVLTDWLEFQE